MTMKSHLLSTFRYNDWANRKLLEGILQLPENSESMMLFSHLILCQEKWLNRIIKKLDDSNLSWFGKVYDEGVILSEWDKTIHSWLQFLEAVAEADLENDIVFIRPADGKKMKVKIFEIALQLNFHSIHHRAQIYRIIRSQGIAPPATDYIHTVLKEA